MTDSNYWNSRYHNGTATWDLGQASEPLMHYMQSVNDHEIKILIPGAGNSWEADALIRLGFKNIYVLDFAEPPLEALKKRLPEFPHDHLIADDFFNHKGQYDVILEQTFFCAIDPSLRELYVKQMHSLLNQGGKLVGVLFNCEFDKEGPPWGGHKNDYELLFKQYFDFEVWEPAKHSVAPRAGREIFMVLKKKIYS